MDPYFEGYLWTTIHGQLASEITRQLAPKIRPRYVALMTERFVTESTAGVEVTVGDVYPDVGIARDTGEPTGQSTAMLSTAPVRAETQMPQRVPHFNVEIRDVKKRRLVTSIEILSPTNKRGSARKKYLAKRNRVLLSSAHLLEIDLLRRGQRVPMRKPLPPADYFVFLSRAEKRPMLEVWPIRLRDTLPTVPVPLLGRDGDAPLDLQAAITTIYDAIGYDLVIDYKEPPEVALSEEDAAWATTLLRNKKGAAAE
jgi:hypothetical protein